ncbi:MAG: response regulator [Candidatus Omnitrophota bacterium]|nr:response regulator [Candidatus Omnitrophota bacterium]
MSLVQGKTRVLIVDDEAFVARMLQRSLEKTGMYAVKIEDRGARGLMSARQFQPHVILLDIVMPDRSGIDVAAEIQADGTLKDIPIIFLSAISSTSHLMAEGQFMSGYPLLPKPSRFQDVMACIERQLQARSFVKAEPGQAA